MINDKITELINSYEHINDTWANLLGNRNLYCVVDFILFYFSVLNILFVAFNFFGVGLKKILEDFLVVNFNS